MRQICRVTYIRLAVLWLFSLLFTAAAVEGGTQTWMTWNTRSGLPGNNLTCLAIDKGKMVVGSDKGIGLYHQDYTGWFNLGTYNEMLVDLPVRSIDFDEYGNLWAATPNGLFSIDLAEFPQKGLTVNYFDTSKGLSTIDVEVVQVHEGKVYAGCYGGWLFAAQIQPGGNINSFSPVNAASLGMEDSNKFLSVGITALAMNYPGGGAYSTKGKGLLRASNGENLVGSDELFSDWVNDFWSFKDGNTDKIIAVTQNQMNLISNNISVGQSSLPVKECWISAITTAPDEETDEYKREKPKGYLNLETFIGKRILYVGTKGQGLWVFNDGRWNNLTSKDCPLPSDNINKVYYLPGPKKLAILSEGGLTMFGMSDEYQFDIFQGLGGAPSWSTSFWPFMQLWGPYVYGYPSQKCYPIEPYIQYRRIIRGKDMWIAHDRGISRFVFPSATFLGAMQYRYYLSGRFETDLNFPDRNPKIEDNSTTGERLLSVEGEELWHHYCKEQPTDYVLAPIAEIFVSRDMKIMFGPGEMVVVNARSLREVSPQDIAAARRAMVQTLTTQAANATCAGGTCASASARTPEAQAASATPVINIAGEYFTQGGKRLYTVASLLTECPLHPIPSEYVSDMALDLSERLWVIFDKNRLSCLNSPPELIIPDPKRDDWYEFHEEQLPWEKADELLCVKLVQSSLYVSAERSGVFFLSAAHAIIPEEVKASDWTRIDLPPDSENPDEINNIISIEGWNSTEGYLVAMLHKEALSVFDGRELRPLPVPKRVYTSMVADRYDRLWLGSLQGLSYLTPDQHMVEIDEKGNDFFSDKVVTMAAAPDNAKYPYVIAVSVDSVARKDEGFFRFFRTADTPPALTSGPDSIYRLRLKNFPREAQIMLFDNEKWEPLNYPGVNHMMFDASHLWTATSNRVMRIFTPIAVQRY